MTLENLSPAELACLEAPLNAEELLEKSKISNELVKLLSDDEKKMLCRLPPKKWPKALYEKAQHYIDMVD
jgi:hypothetical protein